MSGLEYAVLRRDICETPSDLLLLKHAQDFYGADQAVAERLIDAGICTEHDLRVPPGKSAVFSTASLLGPERVMFLGVPELSFFGYQEIWDFARLAVLAISRLEPPVEYVTTTIHGGGIWS